jgi:hypothetical protein
MLNLFQHLINLIGYETLKLIQGDKSWVMAQPVCSGFDKLRKHFLYFDN